MLSWEVLGQVKVEDLVFELHEVLELLAHGVAVWVCEGNNFLCFGFVS